MRSGVCQKCGSSNIEKCEKPKIGNSNSVFDTEQVSMFKNAFSTRYVCLDCGFSERYFEGKELEKLRDRAKRGTSEETNFD